MRIDSTLHVNQRQASLACTTRCRLLSEPTLPIFRYWYSLNARYWRSVNWLSRYGFLPTLMWITLVCFPGSISTGNRSLISAAGDKPKNISLLRASPILTSSGSFSVGVDWISARDSIVSTTMWTPSYTPISTISLAPDIWSAGTGEYVTLPRFHSASCSVRSICLSSFRESSSGDTAVNAYSVPLNCLSRSATLGMSTKVLGSLMRSISVVVSTTRFNASETRESASSALCSAPPSRVSNESASWRAPRAIVRASEAEFCALVELDKASDEALWASRF